MVTALEATDWQGTVGQIKFYGKNDPFTHAMQYSPNLVSGLVVQWQGGKQVPVWPLNLQGVEPMKFPGFIKAAAN